MQIGMVGLGRMGSNMARRLMRGGHECVVFDLSADSVAALEKEGAKGAKSLPDLVSKLAGPRAVWVMLPAGAATEKTVEALAALLNPGDAVIDGGNSHFKDDVRRAARLAQNRIEYADAGTSGGLWGLERGYSLMVGAALETFKRLEPIFKTLAPGKAAAPPTPGRPAGRGTAEEGYLRCGPVGSGHFAKMVHNGIEYGLMQSFAEGFDILRNAASEELPVEHRFEYDVAELAEVWRRGSVVQSWLLTIEAAIAEAVPADVLAASLFARFRSRRDHTFAEKILSAMRQKFGGHVERPAGG